MHDLRHQVLFELGCWPVVFHASDRTGTFAVDVGRVWVYKWGPNSKYYAKKHFLWMKMDDNNWSAVLSINFSWQNQLEETTLIINRGIQQESASLSLQIPISSVPISFHFSILGCLHGDPEWERRQSNHNVRWNTWTSSQQQVRAQCYNAWKGRGDLLPVFPNIERVVDLQVAPVVIINKLTRRGEDLIVSQ